MSCHPPGHLTCAPALLSVGPEAAVALRAGVAHLPQVAVVAAGLVSLVAAHAGAGAGVGAPLWPRAGGVTGVTRARPPVIITPEHARE